MKKIILMLFGCFMLLNLDAQEVDKENIAMVSTDDKEMASAILEARETFDIFWEAFTDKKGKGENFSIKYPFETENDFEHIWLNEISFQSNKIRGIVNNEPQDTKKIRMGETVEIDPKQISDWMYFENGKLRGGKTMILLINRMPEDQRKVYKKALGI